MTLYEMMLLLAITNIIADEVEAELESQSSALDRKLKTWYN